MIFFSLQEFRGFRARSPGLLLALAAGTVLAAGIGLSCGGEATVDEPGCFDKDEDGVFGISEQCAQGQDCDDLNNQVYPGAEEVCGDNLDQDCNGVDAQCAIAGCGDLDGDGVLGRTDACPYGKDCDDNNSQVYPGNPEICGDGIDQNCDDEDIPCCLDEDQDGYGEGPSCAGSDCNDLDALVSPAHAEICGNGKDDDCVNGDAACPAEGCTEATDTDHDGFAFGVGCYPMDCDDTNPNTYPGAPEVLCDGVDQDCSGADKCPPMNCIDDDGDGYGEGSECEFNLPDCNDQNPAVHPGATFDLCSDGLDQDCDGIDPLCDDSQCLDEDTDGFHGNSPLCASGPDCDDTNPSVHPGAQDFCGDGLDQDCTGGDLPCGQGSLCSSDEDCGDSMLCAPDEQRCVEFRPWEIWAPVIYLDVSDANPEWDLFTTVDFDGDLDLSNNGAHAGNPGKEAVVYYSWVTTKSHAYLGYHLYFPKRWSSYLVFGTHYENLMRSILLVIRRNPDGSYGDAVLMETTSELEFQQFLPQGSELAGGNAQPDGVIHFDGTKDSAAPVVFVKNQTHNIVGNEHWDSTGYPGGTGITFRLGAQSTAANPEESEGTYTLLSLEETLWAERNEVGEGKPFKEFGRFSGSDSSDRSVAPWRYRDHVEVSRAAGEFLYDPASQVKRHFGDGWGLFHKIYETNPYAVRVDLRKIEVHNGGDELAPDLYFNLFMRGGDGKEVKVLSNFEGHLYTWIYHELPEKSSLNLQAEMSRYWFYGLAYPGADLFGVEVKDEDAFFSDWWKFQDDWLMKPGERHYSSLTGLQLLDFTMTDLQVWVHVP